MDSRALFETLAEENSQSLLIFLRCNLADPGAVDDAFQDTLISAWRSIDRYDRGRSFGRWLRGIARNVVRARYREVARQVLLGDAEIAALIDRHCESVQRMRSDLLDERLDRLRACIDALPPRYRRAVHLRYREEVRGHSLAARLEVSWENAKKLLQRGRKLLFECMERKWAPAEGAS